MAKTFRWIHIGNRDELLRFYIEAMPKLRRAAKRCGYAIGVHGSMRRDLDLIAVPWRKGSALPGFLAASLHRAACGLVSASYQWEEKPCGRIATMFPVCWIDYKHAHDGEGHIDLSVVRI